MTGSGKTVLDSGATGSIDPGSGSAVALTERELVNEGTLTWSSGSVEGRSNAEIDNSGTLIVNAQAPGYEWWEHGLLNEDDSNVWVHNAGTIKKTAGGEFTQIQFQIDNEGTVDAKTGQIIFSGGTRSGTAASGTWMAEGASISFNAGSYVWALGCISPERSSATGSAFRLRISKRPKPPSIYMPVAAH